MRRKTDHPTGLTRVNENYVLSLYGEAYDIERVKSFLATAVYQVMEYMTCLVRKVSVLLSVSLAIL
jgi:hypothetical protein